MEEYKLLFDINDDIKNLRYEVFCAEQKIDEKDEWDNLDKGRYHFCLYVDNILVSYCRCYIEHDSVHIGRVITKKPYRRKGYGRKVIQFAESSLKKDETTFILGSQLHAIPFYKKLGYTEFGKIYFDANIPHRMMSKIIK